MSLNGKLAPRAEDDGGEVTIVINGGLPRCAMGAGVCRSFRPQGCLSIHSTIFCLLSHTTTFAFLSGLRPLTRSLPPMPHLAAMSCSTQCGMSLKADSCARRLPSPRKRLLTCTARWRRERKMAAARSRSLSTGACRAERWAREIADSSARMDVCPSTHLILSTFWKPARTWSRRWPASARHSRRADWPAAPRAVPPGQ
jgi:hypothetical protein